MGEVFLDALIDSLKILGIVVAVYFVLGLIEPKISHRLEHASRWSPLFGVCFGLIPQCGFSVIAADLYRKKHITMGTVIGVFIATSDEALPIFLSEPDKILMVLPLLGVKLVAGLAVGYAVDLIYSKGRRAVAMHREDCACEEIVHIGCCGHEIENAEDIAECNENNCHYEHEHEHHHEDEGEGENEHHHETEHEHHEHHHEAEHEHEKKKFKLDKKTVKRYVVHPLIHSLKIFAYVLVINVIFGIIMYYAADKVTAFLSSAKYAAPVFAVLVGLIPNCASSVILSELFISNVLSFGACVAGLCVNAGLGLLVLYKDVKKIKENLLITAILILSGLAVGYICCAVAGF